ncbi:hypothetical protein [Secundilactobacillus similis]|uniref:carbamoyl phosphate synthase preATP-grasp domain-containing protein n=1 Tax=Secundilactobacillus similis TaxID=414682 RepID=UPI000A4147D2|nr:hypothetical protein [Secundilactobacillus similis]
MDNAIQKVLIIGGGPTEIGHETELDAACVQIIQAFKKMGVRPLLIDNNPFSAALESVQPTNMFIQTVTAERPTDHRKRTTGRHSTHGRWRFGD